MKSLVKLSLLFIVAITFAACSFGDAGSDTDEEDQRAAAVDSTSSSFSAHAAVARSPAMLDGGERTVAVRMDEAQMATRIVRALAEDSTLRRYTFDVDVVNGQAVVRGQVRTEPEQARVERVVESVEGVYEVINEVTTQ